MKKKKKDKIKKPKDQTKESDTTESPIQEFDLNERPVQDSPRSRAGEKPKSSTHLKPTKFLKKLVPKDKLRDSGGAEEFNPEKKQLSPKKVKTPKKGKKKTENSDNNEKLETETDHEKNEPEKHETEKHENEKHEPRKQPVLSEPKKQPEIPEPKKQPEIPEIPITELEKQEYLVPEKSSPEKHDIEIKFDSKKITKSS